MKWISRLLVVLALVAGAGVLVYLWIQPPPQAEELPIPQAQAPPPRRQPRPATIDRTPKRGGYYAGRVVTVTGSPVANASVLLVAYNPGDRAAIRRYQQSLQESGGQPDPTLIPRVGDYRLAGEKTADGEGRFQIAADQASYITHLVAYRDGYFPTIDDVNLYPRGRGGAREDIEIVLEEAGRLLGRVVDDATDQPVPGARIDVHLQNPTRPPPELVEGQEVATRAATGTPVPLSAFSVLQSFVSEQLGERVWGIPFQGSNGLRMVSDANGAFELAPLGDTVQLEFIVTHPDYMWSDYDRSSKDKRAAPRRTMVRAGETVEKVLRLKRGLEVRGQVLVRDTGEPVANARVEARSISAYARHWWYRHRTRKTVTAENGTFRVAGLSKGAQNLTIHHPSFGTTTKYGVQAGETNILVYVEPFAALVGRVIGLVERPPGGRVEVNFEAPEPNPKRARLQQKRAVLDGEGRFEVTRMREGLYRVWVRAGSMSSQPQEVELTALGIAQADFVLGGGGSLDVTFFAHNVPALDPVTVTLHRIEEQGERQAGLFVSRRGRVEVDGLVPGRYRLRAQAHGFIAAQTEPFELPEGRVARLPPIEMLPVSGIAFQTVLDEAGRPLGANRGTLILEVVTPDDKVRRIHSTNLPIELAPGPVTVRARVEKAGLRFEQTYELAPGTTLDVQVRLRKGR